MGLALDAGHEIAERVQVVRAQGVSSESLAQALAADPDVEFAVPDRRRRILAAPNDPLYAAGVAGNGPAAGQWYLRAPQGEVVSSINAEAAWNVTTGSPGIVVAVVDTGVRFEHPDLQRVIAGGNLLPGYDMIADSAEANDGDGRDADASDPGTWLTQAEVDAGGSLAGCDDFVGDSSWHGTQVVGADRRAHQQRHGHGERRAQRPRAARARGRQVRRLGLRDHRRHALGRGARRPGRADERHARARDQPEPRAARRRARAATARPSPRSRPPAR